ncbi:tautomerase family protein [Microbacteriaceae bacterium VKM Ac-2854]|nr:tautomerase family protein [Microbacteriaceae bacterium VKM Ac-2854]
MTMPHARIDLHSHYKDRLPELSTAILAGMVRGFEMPATDLFQIFRLHEPGELVFGRAYPEPERDDIVFIEILASVGYGTKMKHEALVAIADELEAIGIPRHDLLLHVIEVPAGDWYSPGFAGVA